MNENMVSIISHILFYSRSTANDIIEQNEQAHPHHYVHEAAVLEKPLNQS